jgi:tyrosine-protein kinase Etk/Wzc
VRFTVDRAPQLTREARATVVPREAAINALASGLETRERTSTDLFDVSYTAGDRYTAQRVLAGIVAGFQARNAEQSQQESRRRRIFLEQQLLETDSVLSDAQLALTLFRQNQAVYSTREEYGSQQAGVVDLEARREVLEAERQSSRTLLAAVERGGVDARSLGALMSSPAISSNPVIVRLYNQLSDYQTARDTLLTGEFRASAESPEVQRLNVLITGTEQRIAETVRSQVSSLDARIGSLDDLMARREGRMQRLPGVEMEEVRLTQQVAATQTVADQLRAELQRARIAEAVEVGQVEVVDPASLPGAPVPQNRPLRILVGLVMGLTLGAGAALVREQMNTTIQRREELDALLQTSTLAVIPGLGTAGKGRGRGWWPRGRAVERSDTAGLAALDARAPGAEAYRTLRTNLLFSRTTRPRTLVVTSAGPAEGKTTTSSNLAATFAQQGMTVVLVDCDLRRPRVHEVFEAEREPGLTQWMLGYCSAEEALRSTRVERLSVLPAGTLPPNPSELLGSGQMLEVLRELQARFDLVILDTPPVLLAPDASVLAAGADGVLLVARAGVTDRNAARDAAQQLAKVGAPVMGGVLNDPEGKTRHGYQAYYSYHRYGYGPAAP